MKRRFDLMDAVFGLIVRLYPRQFREGYGDEMRQVFRDQARALRRQGRPLAQWTLLVRTLSDAASSLPREHHAVAWQSGSALPWLLVLTLMLATLALFAHRPLVDMASAGFDRMGRMNQARHEAGERHRDDYLTDFLGAMMRSDDAFRVRLGLAISYGIEESATDIEIARSFLVDHAGDATNLDIPSLREAAWGCVATAACDPGPMLARLRRVDANNTAVWLLSASAAARSGNSNRTIEYLERAAESPSFVTPHAQVAARMLRDFQVRPYRKPLWAKYMPDTLGLIYYLGITAFDTEWAACSYRRMESSSQVLALCETLAERMRNDADTRVGQMRASSVLLNIERTEQREADFDAARRAWRVLDKDLESVEWNEIPRTEATLRFGGEGNLRQNFSRDREM